MIHHGLNIRKRTRVCHVMHGSSVMLADERLKGTLVLATQTVAQPTMLFMHVQPDRSALDGFVPVYLYLRCFSWIL